MKNLKQTKEALKNAICNNDLAFMENHIDEYDLNERFEESDNDTLLMYSLSDKESIVYKFLIEHGANLDLMNDLGENIIHSAVYSGDITRLKEIINLNKEYINQVTKDHTSPLLLSIALGNTEMAKELISNGANVNQADENKLYPIHIACQEGFLDLVSILIANKADLKAKTKAGNVPISLAANHDHDEIVKLIYFEIYKSVDSHL